VAASSVWPRCGWVSVRWLMQWKPKGAAIKGMYHPGDLLARLGFHSADLDPPGLRSSRTVRMCAKPPARTKYQRLPWPQQQQIEPGQQQGSRPIPAGNDFPRLHHALREAGGKLRPWASASQAAHPEVSRG